MARKVPAVSPEESDVNEVSLSGRVSGDPQARTLPSGDAVVSVRVVVRRGEGGVDTIDCSAFRGDARRVLLRWRDGDMVELEGRLRRRFWRTGAGALSRTEVVVHSGRRLRRAA
jgi:single-strand DNA-binding protein